LRGKGDAIKDGSQLIPVTGDLSPEPMLNPLTASNLAQLPGIRHGFFGREGGVSEGIYAALNCGLGSGDDRTRVLENRARVCTHLGGVGEGVVTLHQTHSATALVIDSAPDRAALPKADAVVTRKPGLVVGALAADCSPVLFADPEAGVVAAAHAGWRGAASGILEAAVAAMETLGARRERIAAAIGPTINQISYEVGPEFETQLIELDPSNSRFFIRYVEGGKSHFDLPGFVEHRLMSARLGSVERQSPCTRRNESRFFSYRASQAAGHPDYGRQISAIVVA
jgi:hypothetical protein